MLKKVEIVTPYGLRFRTSPETDKINIIEVVPQGVQLEIEKIFEGEKYNWGKTNYRGNSGWIALIDGLTSDVEDFRWEHWPTEFMFYPKSFKIGINQHFGDNPDVYGKYGLPGHEGIDFYAPTGTKIFAVADGKVFRIGDERKAKRDGGHNYGVRVYIRHAGGYETIYAHLDRRLVDDGYDVVAGQIIGYSDNTGNSSGSHLHLTMKHPRGQEGWKWNIIDPTPFMIDYLRG